MNKKERQDVEKDLECKTCGKHFVTKVDLREHIKNDHTKKSKCAQCNEVFSESWKMEKHMKTHASVEVFKCTICDKDFYTKWRMDKLIADHGEVKKYCHYFNNNKFCPYEEIGCKFEPEDSEICRYDQNCNFKLCQCKHTARKNKMEEICEIDVTDSENESCKDYDTSLTENSYKECGGCGIELTMEVPSTCIKHGEDPF